MPSPFSRSFPKKGFVSSCGGHSRLPVNPFFRSGGAMGRCCSIPLLSRGMMHFLPTCRGFFSEEAQHPSGYQPPPPFCARPLERRPFFPFARPTDAFHGRRRVIPPSARGLSTPSPSSFPRPPPVLPPLQISSFSRAPRPGTRLFGCGFPSKEFFRASFSSPSERKPGAPSLSFPD